MKALLMLVLVSCTVTETEGLKRLAADSCEAHPCVWAYEYRMLDQDEAARQHAQSNADAAMIVRLPDLPF